MQHRPRDMRRNSGESFGSLKGNYESSTRRKKPKAQNQGGKPASEASVVMTANPVHPNHPSNRKTVKKGNEPSFRNDSSIPAPTPLGLGGGVQSMRHSVRSDQVFNETPREDVKQERWDDDPPVLKLTCPKEASRSLLAMVESNIITADELERLCKDVIKSLGRSSFRSTLRSTTRSSYRVFSLRGSDSVSPFGFSGKKLNCAQCRARNNTFYGVACLRCGTDLDVDPAEHENLFLKPDLDEWAGTIPDDYFDAALAINFNALALQYKGGKFFLRVVDVDHDSAKRSRKKGDRRVEEQKRNQNQSKAFQYTIECCWQRRVNFGNEHIRWVVQKTRQELKSLKKKVNKKFNLDPEVNAKMEAYVLRPKKASLVGIGKMGHVLAHPRQSFQSFASFSSFSSRRTVVKSVNPSAQITALQEWFGEVVSAAADNNRFAPISTFSNPIFSSCLDVEFQVSKNVARLVSNKIDKRKRSDAPQEP